MDDGRAHRVPPRDRGPRRGRGLPVLARRPPRPAAPPDRDRRTPRSTPSCCAGWPRPRTSRPPASSTRPRRWSCRRLRRRRSSWTPTTTRTGSLVESELTRTLGAVLETREDVDEVGRGRRLRRPQWPTSSSTSSPWPAAASSSPAGSTTTWSAAASTCASRASSRWFRLAGYTPLPAPVDFDDTPPAGLADSLTLAGYSSWPSPHLGCRAADRGARHVRARPFDHTSAATAARWRRPSCSRPVLERRSRPGIHGSRDRVPDSRPPATTSRPRGHSHGRDCPPMPRRCPVGPAARASPCSS